MRENPAFPSQTIGPFFAYGLTSNGKYDWNDAFTNNLVTVDTSGERIRVQGSVFDGDGQPVPKPTTMVLVIVIPPCRLRPAP